MLKKHKFYGRDFNMVNLKEEIGDLLYYVHILCDEIDYPIEQARKDNIEKLAKRYPDKFEDVIIRDVNTELNHINQLQKYTLKQNKSKNINLFLIILLRYVIIEVRKKRRFK